MGLIREIRELAADLVIEKSTGSWKGFFPYIYLMKKLLLLSVLALFLIPLHAQTVTDGFTFDNQWREFRVYVPATYNSANPAPVVINMHGYTSDAFQQEIYTQMNLVADTAGFICVYPNGLNNSWNSGFTPPYNGGVDDVGFLSAMIDTLGSQYNVDIARVYACGMSNGGFMSFRLACDLEDRIAAIASVTGTMTTLQLSNCSASRAMPVFQIHGDNDLTVVYEGNSLSVSVDSTLNFWRNINQCASATVYDTLPDLDQTDMSTVTSQYWGGCQDNVEILHYKVENGSHTWPGALPIPTLGVTNNDVNASRDIWEFFLKWEHPNPTPITTGREVEPIQGVSLGPNPFTDQIRINGLTHEAEISVWDVSGRKMDVHKKWEPDHVAITTRDWPGGVYWVKIRAGNQSSTFRVVHFSD